jgi:hypothetical protein
MGVRIGYFVTKFSATLWRSEFGGVHLLSLGAAMEFTLELGGVHFGSLVEFIYFRGAPP